MGREYVLDSGLYALNLIGLHPFKSTFYGNVKAILFITFALLSYAFNMAGVISKYENIRSLADSVDAIPAAQQVTVKLLSVVFLKKKMRNLYMTVGERQANNSHDKELEEKLVTLSNQFKKMYNMYRTTIWITIVLYVSKPLIVFSRIQITEWYVPCNFSNDYCYGFILGAQTAHIVLLGFVVYIFDGIFYAFLFHAYCELEKVKYNFRNMHTTKDIEELSGICDRDLYNRFYSIVKHHTFILKFLDDINSVYYLQLLNHFATIAATIVFGIFFMNLDGFPPSLGLLSRYIPYLMSYHFQLYIYCLSGEMVYNQVCSVGDVIYKSKWYINYQTNISKGMLMVMKISSIQNKLTIGDLFKLNLSTFMSVVKTSISFHAFMQTIYKTDN